MSRYQELGVARPEQFFVEKDILPALSILQQNMGRRAERAERKALKEEERLRSDLSSVNDMFKDVDPATEQDIAYNEKVAEARKKGIDIVRNIKDPVEQQRQLQSLNTGLNELRAKYTKQNLNLAAKAAEALSYGDEYVDQKAVAAELQRNLYDKTEQGGMLYKGPEYGLEDVNPVNLAAKNFKTDNFLKDQMSTFGERTGISVVRQGGIDYLKVSQGEFVDANGNITIPDQVVDQMFQGPAGQLYRSRLAMGMPKSLQGENADPDKVASYIRDKAREDLKRRISKTDSYQRIIKDDDGSSKTLTPAQAEKEQRISDRVRNVTLVMDAIQNGTESLSEEQMEEMSVALGSLAGAKIPLTNKATNQVTIAQVKVGMGREKNMVAVQDQIKRKRNGKYEYNGIVGDTKDDVYEKAFPEKRMILYQDMGTWKPLKFTKYSIDEATLNSLYNKGDERDIDYNVFSRYKNQMTNQPSSSNPSSTNKNPLGLNLQ